MEKNAKPILLTHLKDDVKLELIDEEFKKGFKYLHSYNKSVTFFGSARSDSSDFFYQKAERIAHRVASDLKYVIVTGGGPGIMEAANKGAHEAYGKSIGFTIRLPLEQRSNTYLTGGLDFEFFFARKTLMSFAAETYIFFPGGFGTFDELFEVLTLVQTGKIERVPIILVGTEYWSQLDAFIKKEMLEHHKTIDAEDLSLYTITDDEDEIFEIVKNAPVRS